MSTALITQLYIGYFNRAPDPDGLAYWESVLASGKSVTEIAQYFANQTEFKSIYGDVSSPTFDNNAFVTQVYQNLFGRAPDAEGLKYWSDLLAKDAVDPGVFIATVQFSANETASGSDYEALNNKTEAASFFLESLATSGAAYDPAKAKEVVEKVDASPESLNAAKEIVEQYIDDATGQGPDPGTENPGPTDPTPLPLAATLDGTKLNINGHATLVDNGDGTVTISAAGYQTVSMFKQSGGNATFNEIVVEGNETLTVDGGISFLNTTDFTISSSGKLLIDKTFAALSSSNQSLVGPNISRIQTDSGSHEIKDVWNLVGTANGSEVDKFKLFWNALDKNYYSNFPANYDNKDIAKGFIQLGQEYVNYLAIHDPILDIVQTKVGGLADFDHRQQSLHDNLLGNLNNVSVSGRGFTIDPRDPAVAAVFGNRPVYDGNISNASSADDYDKSRAFDWGKGFDRPDYVDYDEGTAISSTGQGTNYISRGNTIDHFHIVRHEGAGIEIALKAKERSTGVEYTGVESSGSDHVLIYDNVGSGNPVNNPSWGAAKWSFDYSIVTGYNSNNKMLSDFDFKLLIDIDPSSATHSLSFNLLKVSDGVYRWSTDGDASLGVNAFTLGGDEGAGNKIEQNSFNIGFNNIENAINALLSSRGEASYAFSGGQFDIELAAYEKNTMNLLVDNKIEVNVQNII